MTVHLWAQIKLELAVFIIVLVTACVLFGFHGIIKDAGDFQHLFHSVAVRLIETLQIQLHMSFSGLQKHREHAMNLTFTTSYTVYFLVLLEKWQTNVMMYSKMYLVCYIESIFSFFPYIIKCYKPLTTTNPTRKITKNAMYGSNLINTYLYIFFSIFYFF